jgi:hypothetical protein
MTHDILTPLSHHRGKSSRYPEGSRCWTPTALVYVYARETREQPDIAKVLTFDEAQQIAVMWRSCHT